VIVLWFRFVSFDFFFVCIFVCKFSIFCAYLPVFVICFAVLFSYFRVDNCVGCIFVNVFVFIDAVMVFFVSYLEFLIPFC